MNEVASRVVRGGKKHVAVWQNIVVDEETRALDLALASARASERLSTKRVDVLQGPVAEGASRQVRAKVPASPDQSIEQVLRKLAEVHHQMLARVSVSWRHRGVTQDDIIREYNGLESAGPVGVQGVDYLAETIDVAALLDQGPDPRMWM